MDCPYCSEEISPKAVKCKHCGEFLDDDDGGGSSSGGGLSLVLILGIVFGAICVFMAIIAAIAIPNLIEARKNGNETSAIGALKTIGTAQSLFREADKEGDGNLDYGTLNELAGGGGGMRMGLVDSVLGSGTKNGYIFECSYSAETSEFIWFATARPAVPGTTGDRFFATNHEGVIYYNATGPFVLNTDDCTMPANAVPVGR